MLLTAATALESSLPCLFSVLSLPFTRVDGRVKSGSPRPAVHRLFDRSFLNLLYPLVSAGLRLPLLLIQHRYCCSRDYFYELVSEFIFNVLG